MRRANTRSFRWAVHLLAICALGLLVACQPMAPAQIHERSDLLQRMDALLQGSDPTLGIRMEISPDPIVTGQNLEADIGLAQAGYLYVYQVGTSGQTLTLVFPNAMDGANYLQPGITHLPRQGWQLRARGPAGTGYVVAVLTGQPIDLIQQQIDLGQGLFTTAKPYGAFVATLREVGGL